jgi:hypothetical protein
MIICQVCGDMSADKTDDNYPEHVYCDACYNEISKIEDICILSEKSYDSSWSDTCYRCKKTEDEERNEYQSKNC